MVKKTQLSLLKKRIRMLKAYRRMMIKRVILMRTKTRLRQTKLKMMEKLIKNQVSKNKLTIRIIPIQTSLTSRRSVAKKRRLSRLNLIMN